MCIAKLNKFSEVKFPVLRFSKPDFGMLPCINIDEFRGTSITGLRTLESLTHYYLVDITGRKYILSAPRFIEDPKGIKKNWGCITRKMFDLEWSINSDGVIKPDELKELILSEFELHISYWQAGDLELLKENISKSSNVNEIIRVFFE